MGQEQRLKEAGELDDAARQKILEEFKKDRQRIENSLAREKERQLAAVNDMLEKRRLRLERNKKLEHEEEQREAKLGDDSISADKIWEGTGKVNENLKGIKAANFKGKSEEVKLPEKNDGETDEEYLRRI